MRSILGSLAVLALALCCLNGPPARADDSFPGLADGGSIVTPTDGGSQVVAQLINKPGWLMATRCEGAQSTRYRLCTDLDAGCAPTAADQLLDYDITQDIPVNRVSGLVPKQFIGLKTDDGGIPRCLVHQNQ